MSAPDISERDIDAVVSVLRSGRLSIGPVSEEFERRAAERAGARFGVTVSSGTTGLHLCFVGAGAAPGVGVITTSFSFAASVNAFLYAGATPIFADIDPVTFNLDPKAVAEVVARESSARVLLPVHVFGQPCDMDALMAIAQRHGLTVIEDAAEAIGASYRGRPAGSFGLAAVFAFYPNKQMTTGEGGMIVTSDVALAELMRSLRNQGRGESGAWLDHVRLGYNYRLDEMSAALGLAQIERLDQLLDNRDKVAARYTAALRSVKGVRTPVIAPETTRMSWFVYVVMLDRGIDRDRVARSLAAEGVPTRPYFRPIHQQPYFVERFGDWTGRFPVTEDVGARTIALPFHGSLSDEGVGYVVEALTAAIAAA
jgi:perosamine synthetase